MRLIVRLGLLALATVALTAGRADAYPELQFSTGTTRCTECHLSPTGGGLLSDYGREEAGDMSGGGDGSLLHGAFDPPSWLRLGGDVRIAGLGRQARGGAEAAVFPMQAEVYGRVGAGGLTVDGTFGVLAMIRDANPLGERLGSREHYVMYEPEARDWYVRAGRFIPAFGLRLLDHTAYVRRFTGLHTLEESYALGGGASGADWDLHGSITSPLEVAPVVGPHGWGWALQYERFTNAGSASWGVHSKGVRTDDGLDVWLGATWKKWLEGPRLLLAVEVDGGPREIGGDGYVARGAGYAAVHYRPGTRWSAALAAHMFAPDLTVGGRASTAIETDLTVLPWAHVELAAQVRAELAGVDSGSIYGLLQLHYYL